jgi:hypothetical protein
MPDKPEEIIKSAYKAWKADSLKLEGQHPEEETFACFLENKLNAEESEQIKAHILSCDKCLDALETYLKISDAQMQEIPSGLVSWARDLVSQRGQIDFLEIILQLKEKFLEVLSTTGDVLVGQEFVPAAVLRSRQIKDFKDEVNILKDFAGIRVEAKIENKGSGVFNLKISVREKESQKIIKDLRVTLLKGDLELESYQSETGSVTFEHILLGKYTVEIATLERRLASLLLDIKI